MTTVAVKMAKTVGDFDAARALCLEWLDWHWRNYPTSWPKGEGHPMEPEAFKAVVRDLPKHHARPHGAVLIGTVDGRPAGCVMYHQASPGVAEFKRMFVSENGRGHGLGRRMLEHMFGQMTRDGYHKACFSSATFLTHARAMYEAAGFSDAPHPAGFPEEWRDRVYFMERSLVG